MYLQSLLQQTVHLSHLGSDAEIDGAVADLDNQAAANGWVDLLYTNSLASYSYSKSKTRSTVIEQVGDGEY